MDKIKLWWNQLLNLGIDDSTAEELKERIKVMNKTLLMIAIMVLIALPIHLVFGNTIMVELCLLTFLLVGLGFFIIFKQQFNTFFHFTFLMPVLFVVYGDLRTGGIYFFFFLIFPLFASIPVFFQNQRVRIIYMVVFSTVLLLMGAYSFGIFKDDAATVLYVRLYLMLMSVLILFISFQVYEKRTKKYLKIIKDKQQLLEQTQAVGNIGSWEYNLDTKELTWSKSMYHLFGIKESKRVSWKNEMSILLPDVFKTAPTIDDNLLKLDLDHIFSKKIRGEQFWFKITGTPEKKEKTWRLIGIIQDITKNHNTEKDLEERELFYRSILGNSYDGINVVDKDINFSYISPSIERILGYKPSELIGTKMISLVHPQQQMFFDNFFQKARKDFKWHKEKPQHSVFKLIHKNGSIRYVESNSLNLYDDPTINGVITNFRDITKERATKVALEKNQATLQSILDSTEDWIFAVDKNYKLISSNEAINRAFKDNDLKVGNSIENILLFEHWLPLIERALEGTALTKEHQILAKGEEKYFLTTYTPILDLKGKTIGCAVFSKNITSIREASMELLQSNQELQQFAYVASHDLQEPLRMVGNFVQLLEEEYAEQLGEEGKLYISYAVDGAKRMSKLIDDLLNFSRVGRKELAFKDYSLIQIIEGKLKDLSLFIKERNAVIELQNIPERLWCEPNQISIVFHNLIHNGIKFNKSAIPKITIIAKESTNHWLFSIQDNGIGIKEGNVEKIFEIFKRLHRKEVYQGTGIGLALVKRIINNHKGTISVSSKLGEGSTFYIKLPKK